MLLPRFIAGRLNEDSVSVRLKTLVLTEILLRGAGEGFEIHEKNVHTVIV